MVLQVQIKERILELLNHLSQLLSGRDKVKKFLITASNVELLVIAESKGQAKRIALQAFPNIIIFKVEETSDVVFELNEWNE